MLSTEEITHDNKTFTRDYLRCDSCHKEIEGIPVIITVSYGLTLVLREYHKYCAPGEYIRILTEETDGIR